MSIRKKDAGPERLTAGLKERIVKLATVMTKFLRVSLYAAVVAVFALTAGPGTSAASSPRVQDLGTLSGRAMTSTGQFMPNVTVQLRELEAGRLAGTTTTSAAGTFSFAGIHAGQYVVEIVNPAGQVIGTSAAIAVTAGTPVTGLTVVESRESDPAGGAATASGGSHVKTIAIITSVAAAAAVVTAVTVAGSASPSR